MSELWRDIRFGIRILIRQRGFTLAALASLVLGIGINTALLTLGDAFYLRPLPVKDLEHLVYLFNTYRSPEDVEFSGERGFSWEYYRSFREESRGLEGLAGYLRNRMNLTVSTSPEQMWGAFVSSNYFEVLGLRPAVGSFFHPEDDRTEGAPASAVISHGIWVRLFAGDPGVVGRTVRVNDYPFTIVGVAPRGFQGTELNAATELWVPATMVPVISPFGEYFQIPDAGLFRGIGRLAPGVSAATAIAELHSRSMALSAMYLKNNESLGVGGMPLRRAVVPVSERDLFYGYTRTLMLATGLILLIACLNVSALLLVRGLERGREIALRQALGASRRRVSRQLVIESLLLFLVGGALSLPVAQLTLRLLWSFRPPQFDAGAVELHLQWVSVLFALTAATVCGILFGLVPALRTARPQLTQHLKEGGAVSFSGRAGRGRGVAVRNVLVVVQMAMALVALIGAGLYTGSLRRTAAIDLGFEREHLALARIAPGEQGLDEKDGEQLYREAKERLEALPGVRSVALSENRLLRGAIVKNQVYVDGDTTAVASPLGPDHRTNIVSPGFFETAGIPLIAGRDFDELLRPDGPLVVIINETMARTLWPGESAVGKRIHFTYPNTPPLEVIGVAADARYRQLVEPQQFFLYLPLAQNYVGAMTLHIRTEGDPGQLLGSVRPALLEVREDLVVSDEATIGRFIEDAMWGQRSATAVASGFSALALILAVVGIYGIVSFWVTQRRRDLTIRTALGARPLEILRGVMSQVAWIVAGGILIGWLAGFWILRPLISSQLYEVSAGDPTVYAAQAVILAGVAFLASLIPARRALVSDPSALLRGD